MGRTAVFHFGPANYNFFGSYGTNPNAQAAPFDLSAMLNGFMGPIMGATGAMPHVMGFEQLLQYLSEHDPK